MRKTFPFRQKHFGVPIIEIDFSFVILHSFARAVYWPIKSFACKYIYWVLIWWYEPDWKCEWYIFWKFVRGLKVLTLLFDLLTSSMKCSMTIIKSSFMVNGIQFVLGRTTSFTFYCPYR
jgi:hypothetical protein